MHYLLFHQPQFFSGWLEIELSKVKNIIGRTSRFATLKFRNPVLAKCRFWFLDFLQKK